MFNMWILAKYAVILRVVGMNCTLDGAVVEWKLRVKATTLRLLKNPLLAPFTITALHSALRSYSDCEWLFLSWQIYFRTSRLQNNLAAGTGQILLLAGQFCPAGRLLPTTALVHVCKSYHMHVLLKQYVWRGEKICDIFKKQLTVSFCYKPTCPEAFMSLRLILKNTVKT